MLTSLPKDQLYDYVRTQLDRLFPDGARSDFEAALDDALPRLEHCFAHIALPQYNRDGRPCFNHLHGDQSASFYYLAANAAYRRGDLVLAQKLFLLNKALNGILCMYDTELPPVFAFIHTVGTVVGKAHYGNYIAFFQSVTVGADRGSMPHLGDGCVIYGGAMVVGECHLGDGVVVAGNSAVIHQDVPPNSVVAGRSPNLEISARKRDVASQYFCIEAARTV